MEEFEASEIVAKVVEGETPNLKHSCIPSTYKGVGQQVKIKTASVIYDFKVIIWFQHDFKVITQSEVVYHACNQNSHKDQQMMRVL